MRQRLQHAQYQKPVFTQSLRQSVKILELPLLELKNIVDAEIAENPAVEEITQASADDEFPFPSNQGNPSEETTDYEKFFPERKENLSDFLLKQLRINASQEKDIRIGTVIINHIDDNGYLREINACLCLEAECSEEELAETLKLIQKFDPAGVGARDLKECLLIQLAKNADNDPLAIKIIEEHLEDLVQKDSISLSKKLKCTQEDLKRIIEKIHRLEPKPGRSFSSDETVYCIPDITIEEKDNILNVSVKDNILPLIRVNPLYKKMLKSKKVDEKTKNFIREKIQNAQSLIQAIHSRRDTLTRVVSIIAQTQKEALLEGMGQIKPLSLKEIAEKVQVHESTISRIVMNKYVQTPIGMFPLRNFFSTGLKTNEGEDVSSQSIKQKIKELVDSEDKNRPLRDQRIAEIIEETQKLPLARRTIAKYRQMLKIPPVSQRRRNI